MTLTPFARSKPDHRWRVIPGEECSVGDRSVYDAIPRHKNIGGGEFRDIAKHVEHDRVVESAGLNFKNARALLGYRHPAFASTGMVSIVGRRKGDKVDRKTAGLAHGRFIDGEAPARRFRIVSLNPRTFFLGPIHRPNVQRGVLVEFSDTFVREFDPGFGGNDRFQINFTAESLTRAQCRSRSGVTPSK